MSIGMMKDSKLKLGDLHASPGLHTFSFFFLPFFKWKKISSAEKNKRKEEDFLLFPRTWTRGRKYGVYLT